MRYLNLLLLLSLLSCSEKKRQTAEELLDGNWFVLYPKDELQTRKQEEVYAATQDSLTELKCLKLLRFSGKGAFNQLDSVAITGNWGVKDGEVLNVFDGGKGFDLFRARITRYADGVLQLTEMVETRGEKLKLVWHLKKIGKGFASALFDKEKNQWRYKPAKEESDTEIRNRLVQMLEYYAVYFRLISEESSYFMPGRVLLPFTFYQHAIGLKPFDKESKFVSLFYSAQQAEIAHYVLKGAISKAKFSFQDKDSYSAEYVKMLQELADIIKRQS
ncbi:MAG: hypothetical protein HZA79_09715 [Sphingobacteriales bacterium]|nr:hypothetical protein [Sphingobacteriales bacterium]